MAAYVLSQKNVTQSERFFDNPYNPMKGFVQ
jgi:hypothetical protein